MEGGYDPESELFPDEDDDEPGPSHQVRLEFTNFKYQITLDNSSYCLSRVVH